MVVNTIKGLLSPIETITNYLNPFSDDFILKDVFNFFGSILDYLNPLSENFILKKVVNFLGSILNYLNPFSEDFILKGVIDFLGCILDYLNPFSENFFAYKLLELLGDLLKFLFVPSEESINNLTNSIKSHFGFIDTINNTVEVIKDMFEDTSALPKIDITLKENKWYSGKVTVIDLSWYAPYKEYGDLIISAFIYVFFLWRIFVKLPSIINGASGDISEITRINTKQ